MRLNVIDRAVTRAAYWQKTPVTGGFVRFVLNLLGVQIPRATAIGTGLQLVHATAGIVVHSGATIGKDVILMQNVTIGRADPWVPGDTSIHIGDGSILCAGAVVLGPNGGELLVAPGTILGAGAVLTRDTGPDEVWAGQPARRIGTRPRETTPTPPLAGPRR